MSRIWWQFANDGSVVEWAPDTLPNVCTLFRAAWINQWIGWSSYVHGVYPGQFAYPYRLHDTYEYPNNSGLINSWNGEGEWSQEDIDEWWDEARYNGRDRWYLAHLLGRQYQPRDRFFGEEGLIPTTDGIRFRVDDYRFWWWNEAVLAPNITGLNGGRSIPSGKSGWLLNSGTSFTLGHLQRPSFWKSLVKIAGDVHGMPLQNGNAWNFEGQKAFVAPWHVIDAEFGWGDGEWPAVQGFNVEHYGAQLLPEVNLQKDQFNLLRNFLKSARARMDQAGVFPELSQGCFSCNGWDYSGGHWGYDWDTGEHYWIEEGWHPGSPRYSENGELWHYRFRDNGWHTQAIFIDKDFRDGDGNENTLENIIFPRELDTNYNYALVSVETSNFPVGGGGDFFPMPTEKWYCHEVFDFSKPGTTKDSKLKESIGAQGLGNSAAPPQSADSGAVVWDYRRRVEVAKFPRTKLPAPFWSHDTPPEAKEMWRNMQQ